MYLHEMHVIVRNVMRIMQFFSKEAILLRIRSTDLQSAICSLPSAVCHTCTPEVQYCNCLVLTIFEIFESLLVN